MVSPKYSSIYHSPVGDIVLGSDGNALCLCDWCCAYTDTEVATFAVGTTDKVIAQAVHKLDLYFRGESDDLDIPLHLPSVGGKLGKSTVSDFRNRVWQALLAIPYGTTISYKELAARVGRPGAVRAVATAVGSNVISIFLPCHRVIGSDGSLHGYRGGLEAKRVLLDIEIKNPHQRIC